MKTKLFWGNIGLVLLILFIDQLSKFLVEFFVDRIEIISSFINLSLAASSNSRFAFSLPAPQMVISLVVGLVFLVVLFIWKKLLLAGNVHSYWLALILGGALSNIFDRIYRGGVLDWIELSLASFHWSSFNLADVAIVVGTLGWIVATSRTKKSPAPNDSQVSNTLT